MIYVAHSSLNHLPAPWEVMALILFLPINSPVILRSNVIATLEKVAGSKNREFATGRSVDTQLYVTPSSDGSKKLMFTIPCEAESFNGITSPAVILLSSIPGAERSKEMSTAKLVSTNVVSTVTTVKQIKLTLVPT